MPVLVRTDIEPDQRVTDTIVCQRQINPCSNWGGYIPATREIALTRLQLAELLLEHYPDERTDALEHLDFAISEFRDMKMQPSLERALKHKDILKA